MRKITRIILFYFAAMIMMQWPLFQKEFRVKHFLAVMDRHDISHIWTQESATHGPHHTANAHPRVHARQPLQQHNDKGGARYFGVGDDDVADDRTVRPEMPAEARLRYSISVDFTSVVAAVDSLKSTLQAPQNVYLNVYAHTVWSSIIVGYLDFYWEGRSASSICAHHDADEVEMWRRESSVCKRRIFNGVERVILLVHSLFWFVWIYCLYSHLWWMSMLQHIEFHAVSTSELIKSQS